MSLIAIDNYKWHEQFEICQIIIKFKRCSEIKILRYLSIYKYIPMSIYYYIFFFYKNNVPRYCTFDLSVLNDNK